MAEPSTASERTGSISQTAEWQALVAHHEQMADVHLRDLFADDPDRGGP